MTATREEMVETLGDLDRFFKAAPLGPGIITVENVTYDPESNDSFNTEDLREKGWYLAHFIKHEGGDYHILMPWGNPWSENSD